MKHLLIILVSIVLFNSCSNEFEISEEFKDIPIVYALINPTDTANYIRLEKAFTSEGESALEIAQNPDSLYYQNASISIARCIDLDCNEVEASANFVKVDGDAEGYPREDGVFATAPNTLYKLLQSDYAIIPGSKYQLSVNRGDNLPVVTGSTFAIDNPIIVAPNVLGSIVFKPGRKTVFQWKFLEDNIAPGALSDISVTFKYQESIDNGPFENKELVWAFANNIRTDEVEKDGTEFYNFMVGNLETNANIKRVFDKVDFEIHSAGPEMLAYINIGLANLGITSTQDIPSFTNMSEGLGIFTSTNRVNLLDLNLNSETLDSLKLGSITKDLNFL